MLRALRLLAILLGLGLAAGAQAHQVRPGYPDLQRAPPQCANCFAHAGYVPSHREAL
jgi:hypothetical protein